jgi:acyl-CoA reductase-like NAD-dependent aldehyde dehydrogenase
VVVITDGPQVAITLAEVLATSDVPGGVVNILTGRAAEVAPWLASHDDVNALDLTGVDDPALATDLERAAAGTLKRVLRPPAGGIDFTADPGVRPMTVLLETKTVWHPKGF